MIKKLYKHSLDSLQRDFLWNRTDLLASTLAGQTKGEPRIRLLVVQHLDNQLYKKVWIVPFYLLWLKLMVRRFNAHQTVVMLSSKNIFFRITIFLR